MHRALFPILLLFILITPQFLAANPVVIDFEGLTDLDPVTTQYSGLLFSNAIVLTSGLSLNEFDFPPFSGANVVSDDGGAMSISFLSNPALSFGGYFTYSVPLALEAYDASDNLVASSSSLFSTNLGYLGGTPNEFISVAFAGGFSKITITGDLGGSSFTLDDAAYDAAPVPEPGTLSLLLAGGLVLVTLGKKYARR